MAGARRSDAALAAGVGLVLPLRARRRGDAC